jgi:hypothetical protein
MPSRLGPLSPRLLSLRRFAAPLAQAHAAERLGRFEELLEAAVDMERVPDEYLISPTYDQVGGLPTSMAVCAAASGAACVHVNVCSNERWTEFCVRMHAQSEWVDRERRVASGGQDIQCRLLCRPPKRLGCSPSLVAACRQALPCPPPARGLPC